MSSKKNKASYSPLGALVIKIEGGGTPSKEVPGFWDGDIPLLTIKDLPNARLGLTVDRITTSGLESSSSKIVPAGIPVIATRMDVGRVVRCPIPVAINQDLRAIYPDPDKVDVDYIVQVLPTLEREFLRYSCGSTVMGIGIDDLKSVRIPLPPLAEQRKIAEILRTWDEAIETAEAELKAKQERKRWLTVSLIFSKGMGSKSKAHKYVPIGDFLREDVDSVDPSQSPGEYFELWSIPAHDKGVADYVKGSQVGSHKKLVNLGDVLISKIVPHIQRSRVVGSSERNCRVIASTEWIVFGGGQIEATYLREVLISEDFHRKFMETITGVGGSLARANVKAVAKIKIPFPSIQEQRKIADVLLCADADADAITRRVELLRTQKRGLMQKLLTGEVRVAA